MMLLRLPTSIQVSMPTVDLGLSSWNFPGGLSLTSVLLSLLASVVLLAAIRATLLFLRPQLPPSQKQQQPLAEEQGAQLSQDKPAPSQRPTSSWGWGIIRWESLPTLPLSLTVTESDLRGGRVGFGDGVALSKSLQTQTQQMWQLPRRGPAFERPLPAIYQSDEPASMAKMIMSRHTFRKPTIRPPPANRPSIPQVQIQRRTPSMV